VDPESGRKVLVLNTTFVPINISGWRRAIKMVYKGKASVVVHSEVRINGMYYLPLVVKLIAYVPIPFNGPVLTRKNVYLRDNHTCQYCGRTGTLTIDHVIPKSRGGGDSWDNLVASCVRCNHKKGDLSLEEAGMELKSRPYRPASVLYLHMTRMAKVPSSWHDYFFVSRN
jgi:5-methylcytosine-specific restriction endonuclease McrA